MATSATEHQHTNRLAKEQSPYLLQHQYNPVRAVSYLCILHSEAAVLFRPHKRLHCHADATMGSSSTFVCRATVCVVASYLKVSAFIAPCSAGGLVPMGPGSL